MLGFFVPENTVSEQPATQTFIGVSAQKLLYDQSHVLEPEMHLHPH